MFAAIALLRMLEFPFPAWMSCHWLNLGPLNKLFKGLETVNRQVVEVSNALVFNDL
jgi:hypothetical protein